MSKKGILWFLILLLIGWVAGVSYLYVCKIRKNCETCITCKEKTDTPSDTSQILTDEILGKPSFLLSDGESFSISSNQNISFPVGKSDITIPDSLASNFAKLAEFLNNNYQKTLDIHGLYASSEPSDESIGMKRAEALKSLLVNNYGVNSDKIVISSQEVKAVYSENGSTIGPLMYAIVSPQEENTSTETSSETDIAENNTSPDNGSESNHMNVDSSVLRKVNRKYTMYYAPYSDYVNSTSEMERYFKYLRKYFKQNPDGLIEIKGYSDVVDDENGIRIEATKQAEMVKNYLIKEHKINPRNLRVKASTNQIPQYNDLDKAKNRKIVFSLKK